MAQTLSRRNRMGRKEWLAKAMEILSREGGARLNVNNLCESLGVTKGSFYAHFEDRADFVRQFVKYWAESFTQHVVDEIDKLRNRPPEERLLALMQLLRRENLARYDIAVRAWAAQEEEVAKGVEKVDAIRFKYVQSIFRDMGFRGGELHIRTKLFVVFHSTRAGMRLPSSRQSGKRELDLQHAFFTRP